MNWTARYRLGELIYENSLGVPADVAVFRMEGQAAVTFPLGRMRLENMLDPEQGQASNFVFWCPEVFPNQISIQWEFWPIREPGLCMLFFAAAGRDGEHLFDASLQPRDGQYPMYHSGEINTYHLSYFRRKLADERRFHTCNLRKSFGFHLVAQGADPIPEASEAVGPYRLQLIHAAGEIFFSVNELPVLYWRDDGVATGPILGEGLLGFRQMAPMMAEYAKLRVHRLALI
ncbi:DUF1961 family protein [Alicyclobacillus fodiniaquatilis]|uniref:DUF1961 family protein n=1 Tax=Alicyclobacillus fodiniaquatilis TaxID=1661150 RepID=A0ABW4JCD1_9BACL